jgi:hypothetical protein
VYFFSRPSPGVVIINPYSSSLQIRIHFFHAFEGENDVNAGGVSMALALLEDKPDASKKTKKERPAKSAVREGCTYLTNGMAAEIDKWGREKAEQEMLRYPKFESPKLNLWGGRGVLLYLRKHS